MKFELHCVRKEIAALCDACRHVGLPISYIVYIELRIKYDSSKQQARQLLAVDLDECYVVHSYVLVPEKNTIYVQNPLLLFHDCH
jgi:hypothetical protein